MERGNKHESAHTGRKYKVHPGLDFHGESKEMPSLSIVLCNLWVVLLLCVLLVTVVLVMALRPFELVKQMLYPGYVAACMLLLVLGAAIVRFWYVVKRFAVHPQSSWICAPRRLQEMRAGEGKTKDLDISTSSSQKCVRGSIFSPVPPPLKLVAPSQPSHLNFSALPLGMATCYSIGDDPLETRRIAERGFVNANNDTETDIWYIIDAKWLSEWKEFALRDGRLPGPIRNDCLIDVCSGKPWSGLEIALHYRGVNGEVWRYWLQRYGGGPEIRRRQLDLYTDAVPVPWDGPCPAEGNPELRRNSRVVYDEDEALPQAVQQAHAAPGEMRSCEAGTSPSCSETAESTAVFHSTPLKASTSQTSVAGADEAQIAKASVAEADEAQRAQASDIVIETALPQLPRRTAQVDSFSFVDAPSTKAKTPSIEEETSEQMSSQRLAMSTKPLRNQTLSKAVLDLEKEEKAEPPATVQIFRKDKKSSYRDVAHKKIAADHIKHKRAAVLPKHKLGTGEVVIVPLRNTEHKVVESVAARQAYLFGGRSADERVAQYDIAFKALAAGHADRSAWGILEAFVAMDADHGVTLGSASLVENDVAWWNFPKSESYTCLTPWLSSLYVVKTSQGRGIGMRLVESIGREAAKRGYSTLYLYCCPDNEKLNLWYERRGFKSWGEKLQGGFRIMHLSLERV